MRSRPRRRGARHSSASATTKRQQLRKRNRPANGRKRRRKKHLRKENVARAASSAASSNRRRLKETSLNRPMQRKPARKPLKLFRIRKPASQPGSRTKSLLPDGEAGGAVVLQNGPSPLRVKRQTARNTMARMARTKRGKSLKST